MKYQITCDNCGTHFLVDAKGGQTIECKCPGCEGTMRVQIPKSDKNDNQEPVADGYQMGYAPQDSDDGGNDNRRHRALALGCLLFVVMIAAAIVAFMALNHTTKKPIEDPYENVMPDTTSYENVLDDTEDVVVDTVQVHKEKPKAVAEPVDSVAESAEENAEAAATDEQQAEPAADNGSKQTAPEPAKSEPAKSETTSKAGAKKEKSGKNADKPAEKD